MRRSTFPVAAALAALMLLVPLSGAAGADPAPPAKTAAPTAEWDRLKSLVGLWEANFEHDGKPHKSTVEVRMTGGGSALMHILDEGTPHEMVSMIHPDGKRILLTHYCAAKNQPRMQLVPSAAAGELTFDFVDGTNIAPGDGHMRRVVLRFIDADHHEEAWSFGTGDKVDPPTVFRFTRVKK